MLTQRTIKNECKKKLNTIRNDQKPTRNVRTGQQKRYRQVFGFYGDDKISFQGNKIYFEVNLMDMDECLVDSKLDFKVNTYYLITMSVIHVIMLFYSLILLVCEAGPVNLVYPSLSRSFSVYRSKAVPTGNFCPQLL